MLRPDGGKEPKGASMRVEHNNNKKTSPVLQTCGGLMASNRWLEVQRLYGWDSLERRAGKWGGPAWREGLESTAASGRRRRQERGPGSGPHSRHRLLPSNPCWRRRLQVPSCPAPSRSLLSRLAPSCRCCPPTVDGASATGGGVRGKSP